MALIDLKIFSEVLGLNTDIYIIIPQTRENDEKFKCLWLLHGMGQDQTCWCRQTSIERYADDKNLCVVMPAVDLSHYADMLKGNGYFEYLTEELPQILCDMLPISAKKEDNYVAGLSMGGYGAFKVALNHPNKYCMAASLSGSIDPQMRYDGNLSCDEGVQEVYDLAFGTREMFLGSTNDLRHMARACKETNNTPKLYMCCGKEDYLLPMSDTYSSYLKEINYPVVYEKDAGYAHTWEYWDLKIQRVLEWMGL